MSRGFFLSSSFSLQVFHFSSFSFQLFGVKRKVLGVCLISYLYDTINKQQKNRFSFLSLQWLFYYWAAFHFIFEVFSLNLIFFVFAPTLPKNFRFFQQFFWHYDSQWCEIGSFCINFLFNFCLSMLSTN